MKFGVRCGACGGRDDVDRGLCPPCRFDYDTGVIDETDFWAHHRKIERMKNDGRGSVWNRLGRAVGGVFQ